MLIVLMNDRKKLSRRLLFDRSANEEHERLILSKLKQQCGGQFTSKMEGMVRIVQWTSIFCLFSSFEISKIRVVGKCKNR